MGFTRHKRRGEIKRRVYIQDAQIKTRTRSSAATSTAPTILIYKQRIGPVLIAGTIFIVLSFLFLYKDQFPKRPLTTQSYRMVGRNPTRRSLPDDATPPAGWFVQTNSRLPPPTDYYIYNDVCGGGRHGDGPDAAAALGDPFLLVIVECSHQNYARRAAMRQTWANKFHMYKKPVRVLFYTVPYMEESIASVMDQQESAIHHDIMQPKIFTRNPNATMLTMNAKLDYVEKSCENAQYILLTDETKFVNLFSLTETLANKDAKYGTDMASLFTCLPTEDTAFCRESQNETWLFTRNRIAVARKELPSLNLKQIHKITALEEKHFVWHAGNIPKQWNHLLSKQTKLLIRQYMTLAPKLPHKIPT